ncbi:cobyrinate a,c-diamide synthase [Sutcliffiella horikoshii]|uniref:Cobyrinate a,c-diamide synthase n=1 Tax=Sutcliffiella horikoshii TaxID=79883 RepID=A0AA95B5M1_9BACI|nr:cobyrinate a,c-diamide synthase [Sutcliffiella horikoshii]TYS58000.1 cobyrinate a,c-diamide synthase [Sutcliffiella horikoshii]
MGRRRILIAGTGSGVGKTTITIGLMAAMRNNGLLVQGFKCGPDFIDTSYHTAVTGRKSRNLDSWMLSSDCVEDVLVRGSEGADISIIEGVMGFYDGKDPLSNEGSSAEISILTGSPVVLVVDCSGMARSAAAMVKGYQTLSDQVNIVGVIANKVGSEGHFHLVKAAVELECQIPVIGYLTRESEIEMPERHLGLVPSIERGELEGFFHALGERVAKTVDVERLYKLAEVASELPTKNKLSIFTSYPNKKVRIAVAYDAAFHFYYEENLELLQSRGAELIYFSPLENEVVPSDVDGVYLGGGFPEEFAARLSSNTQTMDSIYQAVVKREIPTFAECGGYMYLCEEIVTAGGETYPMVGVIPGIVHMQTRLAALGYREVKGLNGNFLLKEGEVARGHEFHYSTFHHETELPAAFETKGMRGRGTDGYVTKNLVAGYTHIHFGSNPSVVENWIQRCLEVKLHV